VKLRLRNPDRELDVAAGGRVSKAFEAGERVLFVDARDRTYLVRLQTGGTFHTHGGTLSHDLVIGQPEGIRLETAGGMTLVAFRPRYADYALKMRGARR
jgi:tRNA (adenine57-N1/adenine58-N1)-methyltransferase